MRHERVAGCEVDELHPAKFGDCRVRCLGVAPCDLFLIILRKSGGNAKVDANVLELYGFCGDTSLAVVRVGEVAPIRLMVMVQGMSGESAQ